MKKRAVTLQLKRTSIVELSPRQLRAAGGLVLPAQTVPDLSMGCPCTNRCPFDP